VSETFNDELDAHVVESMADPEYAAAEVLGEGDPGKDYFIDGSDPTDQMHLCMKGEFGEELAAGTVEECCASLWMDEGIVP
jgi:hypothetical protein